MITTTIKQVKVIDAKSAEDYERQFNEVLRELADCKPTFQQDSSNPFLVFVYYETKEYEPEGYSDAFNLKGKRFYCKDCPSYFEQVDGRKKPRCLKHGVPVRPDRGACEEWLEQIMLYEKACEKGFYE